jgi:hypothetical protein
MTNTSNGATIGTRTVHRISTAPTLGGVYTVCGKNAATAVRTDAAVTCKTCARKAGK